MHFELLLSCGLRDVYATKNRNSFASLINVVDGKNGCGPFDMYRRNLIYDTANKCELYYNQSSYVFIVSTIVYHRQNDFLLMHYKCIAFLPIYIYIYIYIVIYVDVWL